MSRGIRSRARSASFEAQGPPPRGALAAGVEDGGDAAAAAFAREPDTARAEPSEWMAGEQEAAPGAGPPGPRSPHSRSARARGAL